MDGVMLLDAKRYNELIEADIKLKALKDILFDDSNLNGEKRIWYSSVDESYLRTFFPEEFKRAQLKRGNMNV